jgi:hypothetical protein
MLKYLAVRLLSAGLTVLFLFFLAPAQQLSTNVRLPRQSQKASVMQTIGVTDLTITYSRPAVKGRKIWGDAPPSIIGGTATLDDSTKRLKDAPIVPYGHVWRTGANEATIFAVTDDVLINGQKLAAGSYSLHTIPGKEEWTIIFNTDAKQWGSFSYDEKKDALRVKAKPQTVSDKQEWLIYSIPVVSPNSAQIVIRWEKNSVSFTVEIPNVEELTQAKIKAIVTANPTDWQIPLNIAGQYAGNDDFEEAVNWIERSIKIKETFQNLSMKAQLLLAAGRKDDALIVADKAIQRGKADNVDTTRFEKRIAELKAGKK